MNSFSPCSVLKKRAREQLFMNLGTVIGAFLVHMLCVLPISFIVSSTDISSVKGIVIYVVLTVLVDLYSTVFIVGEKLIYLKFACHQEAGVLDVFFAFRGLILKTAGVELIPALISNILFAPVILMNDTLLQVMPTEEEMLKLLSENNYVEFYKLSNSLMPMMMTFLGLFVAYYIVLLIVKMLFSQTHFIMLDYQDMSVGQIIKYNFKIMKGSYGRYLYMMLSFIPWYLCSFLTCGLSYIWTHPYIYSTYTNFYLDLVTKRKQGE